MQRKKARMEENADRIFKKKQAERKKRSRANSKISSDVSSLPSDSPGFSSLSSKNQSMRRAQRALLVDSQQKKFICIK